MEPYSREYWKSMLPVITAFVNGEMIQTQRIGCASWTDDDGDGISFVPPLKYRVKPADPFRLNTLEEQVELLIHKLNGGRLECRVSHDPDRWGISRNQVPSFVYIQYRIAKEN